MRGVNNTSKRSCRGLVTYDPSRRNSMALCVSETLAEIKSTVFAYGGPFETLAIFTDKAKDVECNVVLNST